MLGTFAGALDARKINAKEGRLTADARGDVGLTEDGVLQIRRVHGIYVQKCPVYRSLRPAFEISSSWELEAEAAA